MKNLLRSLELISWKFSEVCIQYSLYITFEFIYLHFRLIIYLHSRTFLAGVIVNLACCLFFIVNSFNQLNFWTVAIRNMSPFNLTRKSLLTDQYDYHFWNGMFGTLQLNISKLSGEVRESSEMRGLYCDIRKYFVGYHTIPPKRSSRTKRRNDSSFFTQVMISNTTWQKALHLSYWE